jgi:hypothetical protein
MTESAVFSLSAAVQEIANRTGRIITVETDDAVASSFVASPHLPAPTMKVEDIHAALKRHAPHAIISCKLPTHRQSHVEQFMLDVAHDIGKIGQKSLVIEVDPRAVVRPVRMANAIPSAADLETMWSPSGDGEHPGFPREDWRAAVANDDTIQGYWDWLHHELAKEADLKVEQAREQHNGCDVYVQFEMPSDQDMQKLGPFAYAQITYGELRVELPDGTMVDDLAVLDKESGMWRESATGKLWTDIVIFTD